MLHQRAARSRVLRFNEEDGSLMFTRLSAPREAAAICALRIAVMLHTPQKLTNYNGQSHRRKNRYAD